MKVGDFGFSTLATSRQHLNTFCGSPPSAAPELFEGDSYLGPPVDIWALGVMLYFILTGDMPFSAKSMPELKLKILEGELDMPGAICPAAQWLVAGMLTVNTTSRLTMEDIASSKWLTLRDGVATELLESTENVGNAPAASTSTLEDSFHVGESLDAQVLGQLKELGVPLDNKDQLYGEPRSPIAGTYRILLHCKLCSERSRQTISLQSYKNQQDGQVLHERLKAIGMSQRPQQSVTRGRQTTSPHNSKICTIL